VPRVSILLSLLLASAIALPGRVASAAPSAAPVPGGDPLVARPAPRRFHAGVNVEAALDMLVVRAGLGIDFAARPWTSPLWLRAKVGLGGFTDLDDGGFTYYEAAIGLEAQRCTAMVHVCGFIGVDAGAVLASGDVYELGSDPVTRTIAQVAPSIMPRAASTPEATCGFG